MRIAIIGTAGRGSDSVNLGPDSFARMCDIAKEFLSSTLKVHLSARHLISGGAAFADHVAVNLFDSGHAETLELALPCGFDVERGCFVDTGIVNSKKNPGGTSNFYHRRFPKLCGIDSLGQLSLVISRGLAAVHVGKGFHDRNLKVAEADAVLSFTFGDGGVLKEGGTAFTMNAYLKSCSAKGRQSIAHHVDLNTWELHRVASPHQQEIFPL